MQYRVSVVLTGPFTTRNQSVSGEQCVAFLVSASICNSGPNETDVTL